MPTVMQRVVKPITHKGKKVLVNREPKLIENSKQCLFIKGKKTSDIARNCLRDFYQLKKPDGMQLKQKNDCLPFENMTPLEGFARKYNASLFAFASHNKKRPHNVVLGRMYDETLLDMIELGIENYKGLSEFTTEKVAVGTKPCLLFAGPQFDQNSDLKRLQNLLVDFLQRETVNAIRLQGLEHTIMFTADEDKVYMRSYRVALKKAGGKTPRVELEEIGPSVDFKLRRTKLASEDLYKLACKRPKSLKVKKVKNVSHDAFGTKLGRIHMTRQDINKLQTRKMKGLKKSVTEKKQEKKQRLEKKIKNK